MDFNYAVLTNNREGQDEETFKKTIKHKKFIDTFEVNDRINGFLLKMCFLSLSGFSLQNKSTEINSDKLLHKSER